MKNHLAMAVVATCILTGLVLGISYADTPVLTPTEVQSLRLQVKQKDAIIARAELQADQAKLQSDQAKFQAALAELQAEGARVKVENKWDPKVTFDLEKLTFTAPAPETKPETAKP